MDLIKDKIDNVVYVLKCNKKLRILVTVFLLVFFVLGVIQIIDKSKVISTMSDFTSLIQTKEFVLGGEVTGIKILSTGVLVIGVDNKSSGLNEGDIIQKIDDVEIQSNQDIIDYINSENIIKKGSIKLQVTRGDSTFDKELKIQYSKSTGKYELGLWVKDSSAGIGTITFYEKGTKSFAALGHGITETRENVIVPITSGAIVKARIESIKRGVPKEPGDIKGVIYKDVVGQIYNNTGNGIYGKLEQDTILEGKETIEVASKQEIQEGEAYIYCTLDNNSVSKYKININSVLLESTGNKNMVIQVKDEKLIEKTGGIVQGMSGSPIVQNGKLIGAVTHVFLNDPTKGYAVFIENMIEDLSSME
ncbi:MAG: SpoIVB peptidase [Clostridia bacterium]|nr:SpoIVB peptidase [Clostridia bacterium]